MFEFRSVVLRCFWLALFLGIQTLGLNVSARAGSACTGGADCSACQNCHGCQHCAKQHGTCGVKEGLRIMAEQRADAPFVGSWNVGSSDGQGREETLQADGSMLTAGEGAGRWTVSGGYLFVRFDDPTPEQQTFDVSSSSEDGPADVIEQAQRANGSFGTPRALLVKASLMRNLKICDGLGLLTPENRQRLRHGQAPVVTRGPYRGEPVHVDHIVPLAHAWDVDNELANLELLPRTLNWPSARYGSLQGLRGSFCVCRASAPSCAAPRTCWRQSAVGALPS